MKKILALIGLVLATEVQADDKTLYCLLDTGQMVTIAAAGGATVLLQVDNSAMNRAAADSNDKYLTITWIANAGVMNMILKWDTMELAYKITPTGKQPLYGRGTCR